LRAAAAPVSAGYAPKSLFEKLGVKPEMAAGFIALPPHLGALASNIAFASIVRAEGWGGLPERASGYDFIHAFAKNKAVLEAGLACLRTSLKPAGMIWVSWPKKASKIVTDLSDAVVRAEALKLDLVDVKVASVDERWSGLNLVLRKNRR
jgi:hypothetical protein